MSLVLLLLFISGLFKKIICGALLCYYLSVSSV